MQDVTRAAKGQPTIKLEDVSEDLLRAWVDAGVLRPGAYLKEADRRRQQAS